MVPKLDGSLPARRPTTTRRATTDNVKTPRHHSCLLARTKKGTSEADRAAAMAAGTRSDGKRPRREREFAGRRYILGTIHPASDEIQDLASTLGMRLVLEAYQPRTRPNPGTFFGKGRLTQLRSELDEWKAGIRPAAWTADGQRWRVTGPLDGWPDDDDEWDPTARTAWHGTPRERLADLPAEPVDGARDASLGTDNLSASGATDATSSSAPKTEAKGDPLDAHEEDLRGEGGVGNTDRALAADARLLDALETNEIGVDGAARVFDAPEPQDLPARGGPVLPYPEDLLLVLDEDVRPSVLFNLEERLGVEVWDRTRLILEIFSQHAHVKEARLQVELAKLQYEIPLIHEAVHRKSSGERPGFKGGGDYGVADYEDFIKRRMRSIKDELARIQIERGVRRKVRRERFYLLSLAGYTNAGKSSLLNALTDAGSLSEGTLFSTLETTTRRLPAAPGASFARPILLTDTVGFIEALPSWLLDAFHSTLEEIGVSDVVLLVADASDSADLLADKVAICRNELSFLDVTCPVLLVLNKADLVPPAAIAGKLARLEHDGLARADQTVIVSSLTAMGIDDLLDAVDAALPDMIRYQAEVPATPPGQKIVSLAYERGAVDAVDYGVRIQLDGTCDPLFWKMLVKEANAIQATVRRMPR